LVKLAGTHPELYVEAFAATQEALISRAGDALRRAMRRFAMENTELAQLIDDREDASDSIRQINALLSRALTSTGTKASREELRLRQLHQQKG
jgi:hypothetical protein